MRPVLLAGLLCLLPFVYARPRGAIAHKFADPSLEKRSDDALPLMKRQAATPIAPKVLIINLFGGEEGAVLSYLNTTQNITVPGLSPLYPFVRCSDQGICQATLGEGEINAAVSSSAIFLSPLFNLTQTYIIVAGIAGINPNEGTLGDIGWSRFVVQWALQYELDARQIPSNFSTGYWAYGTTAPGQYPNFIYGTEIFELNANLLSRALNITSSANLTDNARSIRERAEFPQTAAKAKPSVKRCDSVTSDAYFTGSLMGDAVSNWTKTISNGTATYCMTAQEDNAIAESLVRASKANLTDFSRFMVLRAASDFDRSPGNDSYTYFEAASTSTEPGGFVLALSNIWPVLAPLVAAITTNWTSEWQAGVAPQTGFYGDIIGTLSRQGVPAGAGSG